MTEVLWKSLVTFLRGTLAEKKTHTALSITTVAVKHKEKEQRTSAGIIESVSKHQERGRVQLLSLAVLKLITIFLHSQFMRYGKELNDGKDIKRLY